LTLHPDAKFLQVRNESCLCTSCEAVTEAVDAGGKPEVSG